MEYSKQKESEKMIVVETDVYRNLCISPEPMKQCCNCKRTYTPLWRSGPVGPKTLCNACGIMYSKKRPRSIIKKRARNVKGKYEGKLVPLGKEVVEGGEKPPEKWGEVEKAALLLLALSCGVVFT